MVCFFILGSGTGLLSGGTNPFPVSMMIIVNHTSWNISVTSYSNCIYFRFNKALEYSICKVSIIFHCWRPITVRCQDLCMYGIGQVQIPHIYGSRNGAIHSNTKISSSSISNYVSWSAKNDPCRWYIDIYIYIYIYITVPVFNQTTPSLHQWWLIVN